VSCREHRERNERSLPANQRPPDRSHGGAILVVETPATIAACKRIHEHQQFVWGFIRVFIDFHGLYKRCLRGECRRAGGCRGAAMDDSCYREVEPYLTEHVYPEIREALRTAAKAMLSRKRRRDHDPGRYWRLDYEPWRGTFYPEGLRQTNDELAYAGKHLTTIEINGTFYRTQSAASFRKWRDETPDNFMFSVKGHPALIVNKKVLAEAGRGSTGSSTAASWNSARSSDRWLWQFAPSRNSTPPTSARS